jgi:hypothetical protein
VLAVSDSDPLAASLACITSPSAPPAVLKLAQDLAQWFQLVGVTEGGKGATIKGTGQGGSSPWLGSAAAAASSEAPVNVVQHTSAYVSIRQHTSA